MDIEENSCDEIVDVVSSGKKFDQLPEETVTRLGGKIKRRQPTARKVLPIICQLSVMKQLFKNLNLICASAVATGEILDAYKELSLNLALQALQQNQPPFK